MNNATHNHSSNTEHPPAMKVGGMRVKNPDPHRTALKDENATSEDLTEEEEDAQRQIEQEQQKANQMRQTSEMLAEEAKRNKNISKNPGTNLHQGPKGDYQPRSMNH
ncbi:hypothetical protein J3Q64DRAFT_1705405 [Phycomyces blakesleeanus]|uniref:Uncharacterized protein n=2 Tax=Phycomyces blakesleeanus TaxID=4837 RepID=A0A167PIJ3_PHYB8|nr:hypothetical protein PHYBLDRAFT_185715 [Phycomyces blakesleeanus NRRL 1555(-)]OAD78006.1 hypothetical protein PHYBLDRAFT_185715 [Phycomyces blakesleeanus NRRL 1555(-)]|eukprot:XP_018296046.1 hypothetical protein PHYBLDRAFT_185715 [Phycomyces blakesleeanus NRRL 1555(-)]